MNRSPCPPEPALWPATGGDDLAPAVAEHLRHCADCSDRVTQLSEHRRMLFSAAEGCKTAGENCLAMPEAVGAGCDSAAVDWIGDYQVQRLLNVGGQAEVYLARHAALDVDVVVKWAHVPVHASPQTARRFADEARLLAQLQHPNLVRVYDVGVAEGRPYLVTEYVAGQTLAAWSMVASPQGRRQQSLRR